MYIDIIAKKDPVLQQSLMTACSAGKTFAIGSAVLICGILWDLTGFLGCVGYLILLCVVTLLCIFKIITINKAVFSSMKAIPSTSDASQKHVELKEQKNTIENKDESCNMELFQSKFMIELPEFKQMKSPILYIIIAGSAVTLLCLYAVILGGTIVLKAHFSATVISFVYFNMAMLAILIHKFGIWEYILFPNDFNILLIIFCVGLFFLSFVKLEIHVISLIGSGLGMFASNCLMFILGKNLLSFAPPMGLGKMIGTTSIVRTSGGIIAMFCVPLLLQINTQLPFICVEIICVIFLISANVTHRFAQMFFLFFF